LPASKEWYEKNSKLFKYLSDGLWMISLMTYMKYKGVRSYLQAHHNLKLLCNIWFEVVINEQVTGSTNTHLDFSDSGFNCVVLWREYKGESLVLWQLGMIMKLEPGDTFFFMGSLIAHNIGKIEGVRNSIVLFCYTNILS
jgi:hypothetical protein